MVEYMTEVFDDILQCVTVEIFMEKRTNVIVSCIYRTPGSCMDILRD